MDFNAHVTTDDQHHLTADSRVFVTTGAGVAETTVPENAGDRGGVMFWPRVREALAGIGWRPTDIAPGTANPGWDESEPGIVRFNAVPRES